MTSNELEILIAKHKPKSIRYTDRKSYKIGENAGIYQYPKQPDPDNRVPVPFIRRAVKLLKGYFAKVGNITYSDTEDWFNQNLKEIYDENNEEIETAAIFEDAITYGTGYELVRFNKDIGFEFAVLPVDQCIPIYSDDLKPKLKEFVWVRGERATYYNDKEYIEFSKDKDGAWSENEDYSGIHLFGRVPILEAVIDRDKRNIFDHVLPLIDLYDKIISHNVGDEHEKFAESILLLRDAIDGVTQDDNGLTDVDKINRFRIIDKLGDNVATSAQYLERNVNDAFIQNTLDRTERLIYEMLCIFNPNDDSFATASGIAQAYKLLGFELAVADMESYFSQFLQERIKLIANHGAGRIPNPEKANYVTIHFTRNLPFNMESFASMATVLSGGKQILSTDTIRKMMPSMMYSPDEAEKVKAEEITITSPYGNFE